MHPVIDITLRKTSRLAFGFGAGLAALFVLVLFSASISVLGKIILLVLSMVMGLAALSWIRTSYKLRFYGSYWLIDELPSSNMPNDVCYSYEMTLTAMHTLPFCKQLVFACESRKVLSLLVFRDQVSADTWRKLCVLSNFKQFGNKFY